MDLRGSELLMYQFQIKTGLKTLSMQARCKNCRGKAYLLISKALKSITICFTLYYGSGLIILHECCQHRLTAIRETLIM